MSSSLPKDWRLTTLGQTSEFVMGQAPLGSACNKDGVGVPFVKAGEFSHKYPLIREWTTAPLKFARVGDVLMCVVGATCGKLNLGIDCAIGRSVAAIRPSEILNTSYLYNFLTQLVEKLRHGSAGSAQGVITKENLDTIDLPLPALPEQQKIAAILTSVDEVIESTQAQINKLKDLKTGMMQELLTKGIGHTEFKDSPVGRIPKGWVTSTFSGCANIRNNLRKPINKEEREFIKGIYPYYGPTKALDFINEYRVEGEHVLIGEDGDHFIKFSTWAMTQLVDGKFNVNNHAHIIRGSDECDTKWIYYYFMHRDITPALTRQGATRYKLNKASLEDLEMALPPVAEQRKIISIFDGLMEKLCCAEIKISALQGIKKALMQDLLTGKVRVAVAQS